MFTTFSRYACATYIIIIAHFGIYDMVHSVPRKESSLAATTKDRICGSFLGSAIGDAMGRVTEFLSSEEIWKRYPHGIRNFNDFKREDFWPSERGSRIAPFTDGTQMALMVLEAAIESRAQNWDEQRTMDYLARKFIYWSHDPDGGRCIERAPEKTCSQACVQLEHALKSTISRADRRWWLRPDDDNVAHESGSGSLMRVAPIGYVFCDQLEKAKSLGALQSKLTHRHPKAQAACVAMVTGIICALRNYAPGQIAQKMAEAAKEYSIETAAKITTAINYVRTNMPAQHVFTTFLGWAADDAIAAAVYCMLKSPDNVVSAIKLGVHTPGDSDTIASLAGALVGARRGLKSIPKTLVNRLEKSSHLCACATRAAQFFDEHKAQS